MKNVLVDVIENHGCMSENQLVQIAQQFPNLRVGVKMGCSLRFAMAAKYICDEIDQRISTNPADYVREAFICADDFETLKRVLGVTN